MLAYPEPRTSAATPIDEPQQANVIFQKMCAYIALEYYNNKNDTRFELVVDEALESSCFANSSGTWTHCSFNAKDDSSIHNLFAELQFVLPTGLVTTTCKILRQGETQVGCDNCKSVIHPIIGYLRAPHGDMNHFCSSFSLPVFGYRGVNLYKELGGYPRLPDPPTYYQAPNFNIIAWRDIQSVRGKKFANRALHHYNKTNGTKFAIVNDYCTDWSPASDLWIHISFNAIDSSVEKLFFAEIIYDKFSEPAVTVCKIVEGETKSGCEHCAREAATHPIVGYRGDFLVETKIDKKDNEACYKVYCEEFLGKTYVGPNIISHS